MHRQTGPRRTSSAVVPRPRPGRTGCGGGFDEIKHVVVVMRRTLVRLLFSVRSRAPTAFRDGGGVPAVCVPDPPGRQRRSTTPPMSTEAEPHGQATRQDGLRRREDVRVHWPGTEGDRRAAPIRRTRLFERLVPVTRDGGDHDAATIPWLRRFEKPHADGSWRYVGPAR